MRIKRYKEEWFNILRQNFILLFLVIVLSLVNIFLAINLVRSSNNKLVVLVPPKVTDKLEFLGSKPSVAYLRSMGFYAVSLLSSYTPSNIGTQFKYFLSLVPSSHYHLVEEKLRKIEKNEKKYEVSQEFGTNGNIKVYTDKIVVEGTIRRYLSGKLIDTLPVRYTIYYRVGDLGNFEVLGYELDKI